MTNLRRLLTLIALVLLLTGSAIALARTAPALDVPGTIGAIALAAGALVAGLSRNDKQDR